MAKAKTPLCPVCQKRLLEPRDPSDDEDDAPEHFTICRECLNEAIEVRYGEIVSCAMMYARTRTGRIRAQIAGVQQAAEFIGDRAGKLFVADKLEEAEALRKLRKDVLKLVEPLDKEETEAEKQQELTDNEFHRSWNGA